MPNLKKKLVKPLIKVLSFFNAADIFEIRGEYFIYGFNQEVKFQTKLLKNFEWDDKDNIYSIAKVFTSKFEPIYPHLLSKDKI